MARLAWALVAAGALTGCVTDDPGFRGVTGVREITEAEAASCTPITDIRATPGVYGPLAQQGLQYARNQALDLAKESGANAVVFRPVSPGSPVYEIRARAYRC